MWGNKKKSLQLCTECRTRLPIQAEACPDCGYPVTVGHHVLPHEHAHQVRRAMMEYRLIQLLGVVVFGAGVVAALADSPIGATVAITVGCATYMTGLLGAWWNSGN